MADALKHAITMPFDEQKRRNVEMQKTPAALLGGVLGKKNSCRPQLHSEMKANVNTSKVDANNQQHIVDAFHMHSEKQLYSIMTDFSLIPRKPRSRNS